MDAKITKKRLSRMLSYDWLKMVLAAAAIIIVWTLIFTMTATRITPAQQYTVFNYDGNRPFSMTKFNKVYDDAFDRGIFSHEVIKATSYDMTTTGSNLHTVMDSRLQTDEGDAIFVSKEGDPDFPIKDDDGNVIGYEYTYLQTFVMRYGYYLYDINDYLDYMKKYLNKYYIDEKGNPDYENGVLNEEKVEQDFRTREKNDKRFKTEKQKKAGVKKDIERIQKYRDALVQFYKYLNEDKVISLEYTTIKMENEKGEEETLIDNVAYSINLCPNAETMGGLKNYAAYTKMVVDEQTGKKHNVESAENMQLCLFKLKGVNKNFVGENLIFINEMVRLSLEATKK
ncbi:MAG: hypothetical protein E7364_01590 [Clostridiales bacterium]|nr:hypothetical protein [Clostridiales bacterium]